ncbi:alpha/beta hydrolase-fold protein [Kangiella koreensis]|uniref:Esterase n=1 Tax=Kangiella koreensis (strain DSM 16069 / JCM 12317 / KCTC 12182 / SW-125) TaxID=523791 RepID=C7R758_KANKD|nr:alpha/beta hydrolase-fold protein [Kangiella koreensis]ACV27514.1 hypothetical protein Kkor_2104 [Kangiella koreensis DSM 16069]
MLSRRVNKAFVQQTAPSVRKLVIGYSIVIMAIFASSESVGNQTAIDADLVINKKALLIGTVTQVELHSKVLNQSRSISIHLPEAYTKSENAYPVLYLLDGERHLPHALLATRLYLELEAIPELIINGLGGLGGASCLQRLPTFYKAFI